MITAEPSTRVEQYAAEAAAIYYVETADVTGTGRSAPFVKAGKAVWQRLADEGFSTSSIARAVGQHHTTVMHALES
jgi:chromosomal replication initiation ATPase DnaA